MNIGRTIGSTAAIASLALLLGCAQKPKVEEIVQEDNSPYFESLILKGLVDYFNLELDSAAENLWVGVECYLTSGLPFDWQYGYVAAMACWEDGMPVEVSLRILDEIKSFPGADVYQIEIAKGDIYKTEGDIDKALEAYTQAFIERSDEKARKRLESLFSGEQSFDYDNSFGD